MLAAFQGVSLQSTEVLANLSVCKHRSRIADSKLTQRIDNRIFVPLRGLP